jgi:pSer/pThr/pTyr-binding forkhead associated (FHA) protein
MLKQRYKLTIEEKGVEREAFIEMNSFVVGRTSAADIVIPSDLISRKQLQISIEDDMIWVEDLGSTNGSWVDGDKLLPGNKIPVRLAQKISLGSKAGPFIRIDGIVGKEITNINIRRETTNISQIPRELKVEDVPLPVREETFVAKVANGPDQVIPVGRPEIRQTPPQDSQPFSVKKLRSVPSGSTVPKFDQVKSEAENKLFEHIRALVGNEAEEIRHASIEEAKYIRQEAELDAQKIIRLAREKAEKAVDESENFAKQRMASLQQFESETREKVRLQEAEVKERVRLMQNTHDSLDKRVSLLRTEEESLKINLAHVEEVIRKEEARIDDERVELEHFRSELVEEKRVFEVKVEETEIEERRIRAKMETEFLEAQLRVTQLTVEANKFQKIIETLEPEVEQLKLERQQQIDGLRSEKIKLEDETREVESKLRRHQNDLDKVTHTFEQVTRDLNDSKLEHERLIKQNDAERHALTKREREVDIREAEAKRSVIEAQNLLNETSSKAKIDAQRILEEAQAQSRQVLEKARQEVEETQNRHRQIETEFELERKKRLENLEKDATKVKTERTFEIDNLTKRKNNLQNEVDQRLKAVQEESNKILEKAREDGEVVKTLAMKESEKIKLEASRYADDQREKADTMLEQLKLEIVNRKKEAVVEHTKLSEIKKQVELEVLQHKKKQEVMYAETNARIDAMMMEAQEKSQNILVEAERKAQESKRKIEQDIQKDIEKARQDSKEEMAKIDAETKDHLAKQQTRLAELKQLEMMNIKEMRAKAESEIQERKSEKAKAAAANVYALIAGEMYKARNKVMDEEFIKPFANELKSIVMDTLLDKASKADNSRLQEILKTSVNSKEKEKAYWKKVGVIGGAVTFALLVLWMFPGIITTPTDALTASIQNENGSAASEQFLNDVKEARERAIFKPETTPEVKNNYTDNILYTTDYLAKKQSKEFQDKWILELNEYFISTLDVKDTSIIKFVSLENTFIQDLAKLKSEADAQDPQPKIEAMHARETEFKRRLSDIFEDPEKVSRFYNYSKNFWTRYHNEKKL